MHKPLISKIRCSSPNRKASGLRNYNYLYYIATREGVDLQPLAQELKNFKEDMANASTNDLYMKYINERPRSSGLFGNIDTNNVNQLCNEVKKASQNCCVFRGIISLGQEDAEELNFISKENWASFLQQNLPDIAETFGINSKDLAWVAAFHNEHGHPHVHYMLWSEAKEQHIKPFISVPQQHHCRELLSHKMYEQEHELYKHLRTNFRDLLVKGTRENMQQEVAKLKQEVLGVPEYRTMSRINQQLLDDGRKELLRLVELLPPRGRLGSYDLMPENIKNEIKSVSNLFLSKYELQDEYQKFIKAHEHLTGTWSPTKAEKEIAARKAKEDIDNRLGNVILKAVKELRQNKDLYSSVVDLNIALGSKDVHNTTDYPETLHVTESDIDTYHSESVSTVSSLMPDVATQKGVYIEWSKEYKAAMSELYSDTPDFDQAIKALSDEYQRGNILSAYELGKIYERNLVNNNPELANTYYTKALAGFKALSHDSQKGDYAAYRSGKMHEYGQGTEKDIQSAKTWYEKAPKNIYAQYSLAKILMSESKENDDFNNNERIVTLLKNSSAKNSYASYELGRIYHDGLFAAQDSVTSQKYYKLAFTGFSEMLAKSQKNDDLMYRLGRMYELGLGTNKDMEKATGLFEKAALLKNTNALYSLSKIYMQSGDEELCKKAIDILEKLYKDNPKNHLVSYSLGSLYSDPQANYYDIHKAIKFLNSAADLNNDFASLKLGNIYSSPVDKYPDLPADIPLAISYLEKSANTGNHQAMYSLGKIFSDQDLKHYDIDKALGYLKKSANMENDFAQLKLGNIYLWGKGVPQDIEEGMYWLDRAAESGNEYAEQSKQAFKTYQEVRAAQGAYSLFSNILNALCTANNSSRGSSRYTDKGIKGNKKALRENARKNPHKHSHDYDPET